MMDMRFWMNQLEKMLKKDWNQAREICLRMTKDVDAEIETPLIIFSPEKQQAIRQVRASLGRLTDAILAQNDARAAVSFADVKNAFESIYSNTVVYLLRHPEKTSEKGRSLAPVGVKQARDYALALINEIRFCPKDVSVVMYTSEIERTKKFAQIVGYELDKLAKLEGRNVSFTNLGEDPALSFRFTKETLAFLDKAAAEKGVPTGGGFPQFSDWLTNAEQYAQQIPSMSIPKAIVAELQDFVSRRSRQFVSSFSRWNVVLGFTHSWILDAFRVHYAGKDVQAIIPSAGFVKIDANRIRVDNNWYAYSR